MCNLSSYYIITLINLLRHKIYNVFDYFRNNDSLWKIDENKIDKTIKQIRDDYLIEENYFKNNKIVTKNINLKIIKLLKKNDNNQKFSQKLRSRRNFE